MKRKKWIIIALSTVLILITGIILILSYSRSKKIDYSTSIKQSSLVKFDASGQKFTRNLFVSDIHGRFANLKKTLADIHFSKSDRLFVDGDCIDHGPDGFDVLLYLTKTLPAEGYHTVVLTGDHEDMWWPMASQGATDAEQLANLTAKIDSYGTPSPNGWNYSLENWKKQTAADRAFLLKEMENDFGEPRQLVIKIGQNWVSISHSARLDIPYYQETAYDLAWNRIPGSSFAFRDSLAAALHVPASHVQVFIGHVSGMFFGVHPNYTCLDDTIVRGTEAQFVAVPIKIYDYEAGKFLD